MKIKILAIGMAFLGVAGSFAGFTPLTINTNSFTQDFVIEKGALTAQVIGATTASMDNGTNNTGFSWYEQGYNDVSTTSGLPTAGSTITSLALGDHSYTFAPDFGTNNAVLVDTNVLTATLTLGTPTALSGLSFLTAAGHGPITVNLTVHHADGTSEPASFSSLDWFNNPDPAFIAAGRVDVQSAGFDSVDSGNPNLYSADVTLTNTTSPVTSIDFSAPAAAGGHAVVFAVSGAATAGGTFDPLTVTGYNQDLVVEATAPHPRTDLGGATTGSLDAGSANTGFSYYEQGYVASAPTTGLPPAGSTLTNISAPDHIYVLPADYTTNNGILVDALSSATVTFDNPGTFSALSFLASSGNGAVTVAYTVTHADSTTETGTFVSPDWFNGSNPAFILNGRAGVMDGALDSVNGNNPRLYAIDVPLTGTNSAVTSVDLSLSAGTGHTVIFAISGATGTGAPTIVSQPGGTNVFEGESVTLTTGASGTLPLTYAYQRAGSDGNFTNLVNGGDVSGANTAALTLNNVTFDEAGSYRLIVTNSSGSVTSFPAVVTVLSTGTDVTAPGDTIDLVGGTSPDAEVVANAIDDTTQKYLNFGVDGDTAAPFTGPVGLIVTPTLGSDGSGTVVNALRVYAANDAEERDPAQYTLEGSNDGTTFTMISSGSLTISDARNAAGLTLDPINQSVAEVRFNNTVAYKTYRLMFTHVRNDATANSVQLGEIELLGTAATTGNGPSLTIAKAAAGSLTITSSAPGTLQSTTALLNTGTQWTDEGAINGSTTVSATGAAKFYRVLAQ